MGLLAAFPKSSTCANSVRQRLHINLHMIQTLTWLPFLPLWPWQEGKASRGEGASKSRYEPRCCHEDRKSESRRKAICLVVVYCFFSLQRGRWMVPYSVIQTARHTIWLICFERCSLFLGLQDLQPVFLFVDCPPAVPAEERRCLLKVAAEDHRPGIRPRQIAEASS